MRRSRNARPTVSSSRQRIQANSAAASERRGREVGSRDAGVREQVRVRRREHDGERAARAGRAARTPHAAQHDEHQPEERQHAEPREASMRR